MAGHDWTIINIKPEHADTWLNSDPANLDTLYAIFDDENRKRGQSHLSGKCI